MIALRCDVVGAYLLFRGLRRDHAIRRLIHQFLPEYGLRLPQFLPEYGLRPFQLLPEYRPRVVFGDRGSGLPSFKGARFLPDRIRLFKPELEEPTHHGIRIPRAKPVRKQVAETIEL